MPGFLVLGRFSFIALLQELTWINAAVQAQEEIMKRKTYTTQSVISEE